MSPGGRRARSGPAPDPLSRTSLVNGREFTVLPLVHEVVAPEFPLEAIPVYDIYFANKERVKEFDREATDAARDAELALWADLWVKPQAVMWERLGLVYQVAAYVRAYIESTGPDSNSGLKTAALRMEAELGISTSGMLQNGWVLETPAVDGSASTPRPAGGEKKRQTSTGTWLSGVKVEEA